MRRIAVAGGGNTAMDAVRCALRVPGVEEVRLLYRRTRAEMPADREEIAEALSEGAILEELALPESVSAGNGRPSLVVRRMRLGERDASGRRAPVASDESFELPCDLLVEALGESCDTELLAGFGIALGKDGRPERDRATSLARTGARASGLAVYVGGDAARGPASIIAACADGKVAALDILAKAGIEGRRSAYAAPAPERANLVARGRLGFSVEDRDSPDFAEREAERCLECDSACLRCVEVCPNRANIAIPTGGAAPFTQAFEILHVDGLCNECGNCGFFCPWEGEPFRGKPALFASRPELEASANAGFAVISQAGQAHPALALRAEAGGPVTLLSWEEWGGDATPMASLAGLVLRDHPYLLGSKA